MSRGIAPKLLLTQVANTAAWALEGAREGWRAVLTAEPLEDAAWFAPAGRLMRLRTMLAAHFCTVGTFVPTDVDAQIRHHVWREITNPTELAGACDVIDEVAAWDPRPVSARVLTLADGSTLSGHDGEWLAVRAGALSRALELGATTEVDRLSAALDAELEREAAAMVAARRGDPTVGMMTATVLAHNMGDLSRVVDEWPATGPAAAALQARYSRLGHPDGDGSRHGGAFMLAGHVNKACMAHDNHRYLPLRAPRGLRCSRDLLLPMGPFLDGWGATVARHGGLRREDRGDVLAALMEGHAQDPGRAGYLRAIAGLARSHAGGLRTLEDRLPARTRKVITTGPIRDAIAVSPEQFAARMANRWKTALAGPYR